mgnify:FL=1
MDFGFLAGLGLGLSVGLGVALRIMAARDPVPRASVAPKPPGTSVAMVSPRQREEMTR